MQKASGVRLAYSNTMLLRHLSSPFFLLEFVLIWFMTYFSNLSSRYSPLTTWTLQNPPELSKAVHRSCLNHLCIFKYLVYVASHTSENRAEKKSGSEITGDASRKEIKHSGSTGSLEYRRCSHWEALQVSTLQVCFLTPLSLRKTGQQGLPMGTAPYNRGCLEISGGAFWLFEWLGNAVWARAKDDWCFEIKWAITDNKKLSLTQHNFEMSSTTLPMQNPAYNQG